MKPDKPVIRKEDYEVKTVPMSVMHEMVEKYHYSKGGGRTATFAHGLFRKDNFEVCLGVAWWIPPTKSAAFSNYPKNWKAVLVLSRLVVHPDVPQNAASFLIMQSVKLIKKDSRWEYLLTYADEWQKHSGAIYKATNWDYLGKTQPEETWVNSEGRMVARKNGPHTRTRKEMFDLGCTVVGKYSRHRYGMAISENTSSVYLAYNLVNDKYYVGKTDRSIEQRWKEHVWSSSTRAHKAAILRAIKKYGPEAFHVQPLATGLSKKKAENLEKCWIILLQSRNKTIGYNLSYGGEGHGQTEKSRRKLSESISGKNCRRYIHEIDNELETLKQLRLSGKGKRNISKLTGYSATTISRRLQELGVQTPKPLSHVSNEQIADLYNQGFSSREIAKKLGISSKTTISNRLKLMGISPRLSYNDPNYK